MWHLQCLLKLQTGICYIFATLANMSKSNVSRCSDNATVSNSNSIWFTNDMYFVDRLTTAVSQLSWLRCGPADTRRYLTFVSASLAPASLHPVPVPLIWLSAAEKQKVWYIYTTCRINLFWYFRQASKDVSFLKEIYPNLTGDYILRKKIRTKYINDAKETSAVEFKGLIHTIRCWKRRAGDW